MSRTNRFDEILAKLEGVTRSGAQASAQCPAHEDRRASLSVKVTTLGKIVLHCHAGCTPEAVVTELGLTMADLFPPEPSRVSQLGKPVAEYTYTDEKGATLYQVVRFDPKDFRVRRSDAVGGWSWGYGGVRRVLYRLPEVLDAAKAGRTVYVVEGEKDVEAIRRAGGVATCNPGGAGKWRPEFSNAFHGARVVIVVDQDEAGRRHATEVARQLQGIAASAALVNPAAGKDASDHLAAGHGLDTLTAVTGPDLDERPPLVRSLREFMSNPDLLRPPPAIAHGFAYRGRLTLLAAREKDGKSTLAAAIATRVSRGGLFLGREVERGPVLWISLEEHPGDVTRRFSEFGADPDRLYIVTGLPAGMADFEEAVRQVKPVLVVGDTLAAMADGIIEDPNDSMAWTGLMRQITTTARTHEAAVLLVAHARKSDGSYRDSTAIGANVDQILEMQTDKEDPAVRAFTPKGRWFIPPFRIRLEGTEYLSVSGDISHETKVLFAIQAEPGLTNNAVRKAVGGRGADTDRAIEKLAKAGAIEDRGSGTRHAYWPTRPETSSQPRPELRDERNRDERTGARPTQLIGGQSRDERADEVGVPRPVVTSSHSQIPVRGLDEDNGTGVGHGDAWEPEGEAA